jgi:hypothetical protein
MTSRLQPALLDVADGLVRPTFIPEPDAGNAKTQREEGLNDQSARYPAVLSYDVDSRDFTDPGCAAIRLNVPGGRRGRVIGMHVGHPRDAGGGVRRPRHPRLPEPDPDTASTLVG